MDELISVAEFAKRAGISKMTVYRYIEDGKIDAVMTGKKRGLKISSNQLSLFEPRKYVPKKRKSPE